MLLNQQTRRYVEYGSNEYKKLSRAQNKPDGPKYFLKKDIRAIETGFRTLLKLGGGSSRSKHARSKGGNNDEEEERKRKGKAPAKDTDDAEAPSSSPRSPMIMPKKRKHARDAFDALVAREAREARDALEAREMRKKAGIPEDMEKMDFVKEGRKCGVCDARVVGETRDPDLKTVWLKCGHLFCDECIRRWIANAPRHRPFNCPVCRRFAEDVLAPDKTVKAELDRMINERRTNDRMINERRRDDLGAAVERLFGDGSWTQRPSVSTRIMTSETQRERAAQAAQAAQAGPGPRTAAARARNPLEDSPARRIAASRTAAARASLPNEAVVRLDRQFHSILELLKSLRRIHYYTKNNVVAIRSHALMLRILRFAKYHPLHNYDPLDNDNYNDHFSLENVRAGMNRMWRDNLPEGRPPTPRDTEPFRFEFRDIFHEYVAILHMSAPRTIRTPELDRLRSAQMTEALERMDMYVRSLGQQQPSLNAPPATLPPVPPTPPRFSRRHVNTRFALMTLWDSLHRMYIRTRNEHTGTAILNLLNRIEHFLDGGNTQDYFINNHEFIRTQLVAPYVPIFEAISHDTARFEYNIVSLLLPPGYIRWYLTNERRDREEPPLPSVLPGESQVPNNRPT